MGAPDLDSLDPVQSQEQRRARCLRTAAENPAGINLGRGGPMDAPDLDALELPPIGMPPIGMPPIASRPTPIAVEAAIHRRARRHEARGAGPITPHLLDTAIGAPVHAAIRSPAVSRETAPTRSRPKPRSPAALRPHGPLDAAIAAPVDAASVRPPTLPSHSPIDAGDRGIAHRRRDREPVDEAPARPPCRRIRP